MKTFYIKEEATGKQITSAEEVYETLKEIGKADQETFWLIGYSGGNKEIYRECIFMGGLNCASVDLKIIFKRLLNRGCNSFMVAHNHPSDNPNPSPEDKEITGKIKEAAKILDITFLDHLVIAGNGFMSFKNLGLLI